MMAGLHRLHPVVVEEATYEYVYAHKIGRSGLWTISLAIFSANLVVKIKILWLVTASREDGRPALDRPLPWTSALDSIAKRYKSHYPLGRHAALDSVLPYQA